jgi:hypothetical protein
VVAAVESELREDVEISIQKVERSLVGDGLHLDGIGCPVFLY